MEPLNTESTLKNITGVVESGIFAHRPADIVLMASEHQVEILRRQPQGTFV
jgi:ribose 5-phosphate isomerase A